ncbi:uncharacterized protein LTR77_001360 [Saxophila tyrrhenica]|uniref:Copper homeostasis protein cutC homolog n=1 Tax=Saxophila tyrrhenica TaxID=1690608 RepID=A0AAV9PK28_9PEZI|nr:hypothetical protein LTR77_001360 [Saxophila tyrrhenica]
MALLEIACFTPESAIRAYDAGADRIELCDDREAGGTTPSMETLRAVKEQVTVPVYVMIRARGGNFVYTEAEFGRMLDDVDRFKASAEGFVFGVLGDGNDVDIERTTQLVARASPLPCTFHRAFDEAQDQLQALEDVMGCGCKAILTSGGAPNAAAGAVSLAKLVEQAEGRIQIIVGGGVRSENAAELAEVTKAKAYHSSAILEGCADVDMDEVRQLKALLCQPQVHAAASPHPAQQARYIAKMGSSASYMAAVSAGPNTPKDEMERRLR